MKYYVGIAIRKSGHAAMTKPVTSEQECMEMLKSYVEKHYHDVASTTYITRTSTKEITLADVFGSARSRDLMQDKKFLRQITK